MNAVNFCYTLQGFIELNTDRPPTKEEWERIVEMFKNVTSDDIDDDEDGSMKATDFVVWLKGWVNIAQPTDINSTQWAVIKDHLKIVFVKVTPDRVVPINDLSLDDDTLKQIEDIFNKRDDDDKWKNPLDIPRPMFNADNLHICGPITQTYC